MVNIFIMFLFVFDTPNPAPQNEFLPYNSPKIVSEHPDFSLFSSVLPKKEQVFFGLPEDFIVNDDTSGYGTHQYSPAIAVDSRGNYVIVWRDSRYGGAPYVIMMRRFDKFGNPLGSAIRVSENPSINTDEMSPDVAIDSAGNFVVVWQDSRNGTIMAQRFDAEGNKIGTNFRADNSEGISTGQNSPSVAMDPAGNFIIVWRGYAGGYYIFAQMWDPKGNPIGNNFRADNNQGVSPQSSPDIAVDSSGNFVVVWVDTSEGSGILTVRFQRWLKVGFPLDAAIRADNNQGKAPQYDPVIAMDREGNFVVAWRDTTAGYGQWRISAQKWSAAGNPVDTLFRADNLEGTSYQYYPSTAFLPNGDFIIAWQDRSSYPYLIMAQRWTFWTNTPIGTNFRLDNGEGTGIQSYPDIAFLSEMDRFIGVWQDRRITGSIYRIYGQIWDSTVASGSNILIDENKGDIYQYYASCAMDSAGNSVVVWVDYREGSAYIYAQRYDVNGNPIGTNFRADNGRNRRSEYSPSVAMDPTGNFVVVWRTSYPYYIYGQRWDANGNPVGDTFRADNWTGDPGQYTPDVAMDANGNFVIVWYDTSLAGYTNFRITAQKWDANGNPVGTLFRADNGEGTAVQFSPIVETDAIGNFVVAWVDGREGRYKIYAQRWDLNGLAVGTNFRADNNGSEIYSSQYEPSIGMDNAGNFVIAWREYYSGQDRIRAQRWNSAGTPLGSNFRADNGEGTNTQRFPSVAMHPQGTRFVISWLDQRYPDWDIIAQVWDDSIPIGNNKLMNNDPLPFAHQRGYSKKAIAFKNNKVMQVWEDSRRGKNWDIYAKIIPLEPPIGPPTLISPSDNAYLNNTATIFHWSKVQNAFSYEFQLSPDSLFSAYLSFETDDTFFIQSLQEGGYYWRVRAVSFVNVKSSWSETWKFEVDLTAPDAPVLNFPTNGIWLGDTAISFDWSPVTFSSQKQILKDIEILSSAPVHYIIQIDTLLSFTTPVYVDTVDVTPLTVTLPYHLVYFWRVKAFDDAGNTGNFSPADFFRIDTIPPLIDSTTRYPKAVASSGPFPIQTWVWDNAGVDTVYLAYKRQEDTDWILTQMQHIGNNWFTDTIPSVSQQDDTIQYYILAKDITLPANISSDPKNAPTLFYSFIANTVSVSENSSTGQKFSFTLLKNIGNKFIFKLFLPKEDRIILRIFDASGRLIGSPIKGVIKRGNVKIIWTPSNKKSGIYFYHLKSYYGKYQGKGIIIK